MKDAGSRNIHIPFDYKLKLRIWEKIRNLFIDKKFIKTECCR